MKAGNAVGALVISLGAIWILSQIANDPRISPMWRRVAKTAEGDLYQHVVSGALVTVLG